ncbi:hypothetical protein N7465_010505 [Penicillium sp. CMV-2018d]|nr:hypothetical protein N7465_010505 [Penicillium sp. CMV-2018d]
MQLHPIQDVVTSSRRPVHTPSYRVVESNEPSLASHSDPPNPKSACHLSWLSACSHALSAVKSWSTARQESGADRGLPMM